MRHQILAVLSVLLLGTLVSSPSQAKIHWPHWPHKPKPKPGNQVPSLPLSEKEWTFLVYLNGNNSLDSFGAINIKEMEQVGTTDKVNVVVQWASAAASDHTKRLLVMKGDGQTLVSPTIQDAGDVDMGDPKSLVDFVQWGVTNFPAKHYFVDIWNHGNGWHDVGRRAITGNQLITPFDISWDEHTNHHFTNKQMGEALAQSAKIIGHKIDVYGSDACLMAMPEVAAEVADAVDVFVGSEEVEPGLGWPYQTILKSWNAPGETTPVQLGQIMVDEYVKSYNDGGVHADPGASSDVTFSAFNLANLGSLETAMSDFGQSIVKMGPDGRAATFQAAKAAQFFTNDDYRDLADFMTVLQTPSSGRGLVDDKTIDSVRTAMRDFVYANGATGSLAAKAKGLSIWLPNSSSEMSSFGDAFAATSWDQHTHWSDAIKAILSAAPATTPDPPSPTLPTLP